MRIAILEDEIDQAAFLQQTLESVGHACHVQHTGKSFLRDASRESFDLMLLDWQLPDISGEEVLRWVRENVSTSVPILFVTSRNTEEDIVTALNAGADDYLTKPVGRMELLARVSALLRRTQPKSAPEAIDCPPYHIDMVNHAFSLNGEKIDLTHKEFDLALFFFRNSGRLMSRGHIQEAVWGRSTDISSRTVDTHVSKVRSKLHLRPENGYRLVPSYSYGYRLELVQEPK